MLAATVATLSFHMNARAVAPSRAVAPTMNYYAVYHTFKNEADVEPFWGAVQSMDTAAMSKAQHESGIFNHMFMPSAPEGPILCIWECEDKAMGSADFKTFIDGPESPASGLINKVYPINEMGMVPASAWPKMAGAPTKSTGSFFFVMHKFNKGKRDAFWEEMATADMDAFAAANKAKGFANHFFMPTTDPSTVFCVWESKAPMTAGEFTQFMDGEDGPSPGTFTNFVYPVMEGGVVPSAMFPASFVDEMMAKIEEALPLKLEDIMAKLKEATKM